MWRSTILYFVYKEREGGRDIRCLTYVINVEPLLFTHVNLNTIREP